MLIRGDGAGLSIPKSSIIAAFAYILSQYRSNGFSIIDFARETLLYCPTMTQCFASQWAQRSNHGERSFLKVRLQNASHHRLWCQNDSNVSAPLILFE